VIRFVVDAGGRRWACQLVPGWSAGLVDGDGVASPLAEDFDAIHALADGRVDAEGGPDAISARRVA
jgi:hypothetical protein